MLVHIHPPARERMKERGATETEVEGAVRAGEAIPARFGRTGFRRNFPFAGEWRGKRYSTKQVEVCMPSLRATTGW
jgi:hypothetical protein